MGSCGSQSTTAVNAISRKPSTGSESKHVSAYSHEQQVEAEIKPLTAKITTKLDHDE